jgi:hypothetical protein
MYKLLRAGKLGNTLASWSSVDEWKRSSDAQKYDWWGVRSFQAGGPCRLNCPVTEVEETVRRFGGKVNISMMADRVTRARLWADVYDTDTGLVVYGIEDPPVAGSWRALMPSRGKTWKGLAARGVLGKYLGASERDDLEVLRDRYPGHVIEFSVFRDCVGILPNRRMVVWEVRDY